MDNIRNLIHGTTAPEYCSPKQIWQGRIPDCRFDLCSILIFKAISESIHCKLINCEKGAVEQQFQLWSMLLWRTMSQHIRHGPAYGKGVENNQFQLFVIIISGVVSDCIHREIFCKKEIANDPFEKLPEDIRCTILSKLSLEDAVRTSALSRNWKCSWSVCPKLKFDGVKIFGKNICGKKYIQNFINHVNAVLAQCHGRVVEELAIKIDFDSMLVEDLNNWVSFAVSSWTKLLAFDLTPNDFQCRDDRYRFPFELLDIGSISRLEKIQLSFGCIQPPTNFSGFPNLKKLDLYMVSVCGKDLEELLSNCCNMEWLSIVRCHLYDELKVNGPMRHLQYLNVVYCNVTKVALHAVKLTSFVYNGRQVPIDLNKSSKLETAQISFYRATLEHFSIKLANVLMNVESLTFDTYCELPKTPSLMDSPYKFSHLKFIKLALFFGKDIDILSLVSFLRSTPFIEKFEMHFSVCAPLYLGDEPIRRLPQHPYNYLKDLLVTGFEGSSGQLEFLLYIVENAPALETLTVDRSDKMVKQQPWKDGATETGQVASIHKTAIRHIEGKVSPMCRIRML